MMRPLLLALFLLVWGHAPEIARAGTEDVRLESAVDRALITTTDELIWTISLRVTAPYKALQLPEYGSLISGFRVVDFSRKGPQEDEDRWVTELRYRLHADVSGSYILPALEFKYQGADGAERTLKTSDIFVEVSAVATDAKGGVKSGLRDIKAARPAGYDRRWLAGGTAALGTLLVLGLGAFFWWRRQQRRSRIIATSPHEEARAALEELKNAGLEGEPKEFHGRLSRILRQYCEASLAFPATDRTVEEISRDLGALGGWNGEARATFVDVLRRGDLVTFANHRASPEECRVHLGTAINLVEGTAPQPIDPLDKAAAGESVI